MLLSEQITGKEEDKIHKLKTVIAALSKYQDLLFRELVGDLGIIDEKIEDFLFDFVYNDTTTSEFAEYLAERGQ